MTVRCVGQTSAHLTWQHYQLPAQLACSELCCAGQYGKIYTSMSRIENSMEDMAQKGKNNTVYDQGGPNMIQ